jgi:hypothetical protein
MIDIIHRIGIKAPAADVYQAIASVEGWRGGGRRRRRAKPKLEEPSTCAFATTASRKGEWTSRCST